MSFVREYRMKPAIRTITTKIREPTEGERTNPNPYQIRAMREAGKIHPPRLNEKYSSLLKLLPKIPFNAQYRRS